MNFLLVIPIIIVSLIVIILIIALFVRKTHYVRREILINASCTQVFDFLRYLKNQDKFNKWAKTDANRKETFKGTDGTVGYVYSWSGDKSAGLGEKEIKKIVEGERIETEIRFVKPMKVSADVIMETQPVFADETKVSFTNKGILPYPFNIMIPIFEKNFGKDIDGSLLILKNILENRS